MTTTTRGEPEVVRGYRTPGTRQTAPRPSDRRTAEQSPLSPWRQRIPGPQLPGLVTGVTLLAGLWLLLAPSAWNYGGTGGGFDARWNDLAVGLVVAALGVARLAGTIRLGLATAVAAGCGVWLLLAPFVLAYGFGPDSTRATLNDVVLGLLILAVTILGHVQARAAVATRL